MFPCNKISTKTFLLPHLVPMPESESHMVSLAIKTHALTTHALEMLMNGFYGTPHDSQHSTMMLKSQDISRMLVLLKLLEDL